MDMFCRGCKTAVATLTLDGNLIGYQHQTSLRGAPEDHKPDPVPLTELPDAIIICDFCDSPQTLWSYPCEDQATETVRVTERVVGRSDYRDRHGAARVRRLETEPYRTLLWGEKWAACADCAELIEQRDLFGLIRRVCDGLPSKFTNARALPSTRASLMTFYGNVFATLGERIAIIRGA